MTVLTCGAPYGVGGLGRTLVDVERLVMDQTRESRHREITIIAGGVATDAHSASQFVEVRPRWPGLIARMPPFRFDVGRQQFLDFDAFDRGAARRLAGTPDRVVAFAGQALHTFRRARALGCRRLELVSATAHLGLVWRQHRLAERRYPLERDWLSAAHRDRALAEYGMADVIHVASDYTWDSFVNAGVSPDRLNRMPVSTPDRFAPSARNAEATTRRFQVVYTGILSVVKGTPLLIDAFARLEDPDARLVLVGATGSRGLRRFMEERCRVDQRVVMAPGDPLPHLAAASVYVHPSYQDGFGYAVAEALACGVRVIVTEDTGAKELVVPGQNGVIVRTGDSAALASAIAQQHEVWRRTTQTSRTVS